MFLLFPAYRNAMQVFEQKFSRLNVSETNAPNTASAYFRPNVASSSGKTVSAMQNSNRVQGTVEHISRLFSTYSAPSAVYAENIQLAQGSISPVYQHNIAITKYLNISVVPKVKSYLPNNLIA
jgi:hypothetical protein|tara:strand:- start:465 stop:833 length:369 start_codon:yes stop_codon:yes gene_type:complete